MHVIAGLGNPGRKYANCRHNAGFMAVDAIARRHSFSPWTKKFGAEIAEGRLGGGKVLLVKPQTYMNLSGQAVGDALRFFKLDAGDLTVFYDELDLTPGRIRIKTGGGAGGHNGIKSLDAHCGKDYTRVRIGIGHPGDKAKVTGHVLGDFAGTDHVWLDPVLDAIADNAGMLVKGDHSGFMNKIALAAPSGGGSAEKTGSPPRKGQSHIRQAQPGQPPDKPPRTGPMAAMLKKLFGGRE